MAPELLKYLAQIEPDAVFSNGSQPSSFQSSSGPRYFAKLGKPSESEQYFGEAESLRAIALAAPGLAPKVFACGVDSEYNLPYFISEYKDLAPLTDVAARSLAKRLATELHMYKGTHGFGFEVPTYCGRTRLENGWFESWEHCFDNLIAGLLSGLRAKGKYVELVRKGEEVRKVVIPKLLGKLVIQPVLLHGDLWSGNADTDRATGDPVIFDPSSYFGHNEADLAIARLFGGFPPSFYTAYHEHHLKTDPVEEYERRGDLYEVFHLLNHALLFGDTYVQQSSKKIDTLLKAFPSEI